MLINHLDGHAGGIEFLRDLQLLPAAVPDVLFEDGAGDASDGIGEHPGEFARDTVGEGEDALKAVARFGEIAPLLDHFAAEGSTNSGFAIDDGNGDLLNQRSGPPRFGGGMGFEVLFEKTVLTLKSAFGRGSIAQR